MESIHNTSKSWFPPILPPSSHSSSPPRAPSCLAVQGWPLFIHSKLRESQLELVCCRSLHFLLFGRPHHNPSDLCVVVSRRTNNSTPTISLTHIHPFHCQRYLYQPFINSMPRRASSVASLNADKLQSTFD